VTHLRKMMLEELSVVIIPKVPHASTSAPSKISLDENRQPVCVPSCKSASDKK